jgi:hypothetical protein
VAISPTRLALIPSPLAGPSCWRGVEQALRRRGLQGQVIAYGPVRNASWQGAAADRIAAALGVTAGQSVVVVHSGAGRLVPSIVAAAPGAVAKVLFVDAILPQPGRSWLETAPAPLAERLRALAEDGVLPPWNQWFDADPTVALIPDAVVRAAFLADLPRLPMAVLSAPAPDLRAWQAIPCAYLQLSGAYEAEACEAERRGWRVRREAMHHLAMVTEPEDLAAILIEMAGDLAGP